MINKNRIPLLEEYRLIERSEHEINGAWKGAHILLFFLAFIFGCFCTFCFHMLMYMFDEKCVLFPKLQSLTSLRHNVIYEFVPVGADAADMPVDFLSTQWVEKSACYLPTYVPLVSGIFGLVWTTMFLMCSTGSRTLSGLQRPWRILPPVFVFSLAMGGVCIYSSSLTHNGLEELCLKLSEITGSPTCSYTVNVATLVYERRIRGVYQATRLTILSAWLHTSCWLLSAVLALVRVIMVVDFQLVRVNVDLVGDIDKLLEQRETHVRTVSPDRWIYTSDISLTSLASTATNKVQFKDKVKTGDTKDGDTTNLMFMLYYDEKSSLNQTTSEQSLTPEERTRLARRQALVSVTKEHLFIAKMVLDLVDNLSLPKTPSISVSSTESPPSLIRQVVRQYGHAKIESLISNHAKLEENSLEYWSDENESKRKVVSTKSSTSILNITESVKDNIFLSKEKDDPQEGTSKSRKKTSSRHVSIQTDQKRKKVNTTNQNVQISKQKRGETNSDSTAKSSQDKVNKSSQTHKKEKQD